ncbi:MAG: hypothetical protein OXT74_12905 [Candidatus Poribacteria bacterium]|nr:hypothetical protein [Candidatus Poribacteria bacterium]
MSKLEPIENPDRKNHMREIGRRLFQPHDTCEAIFKPAVEACLMFHTTDRSDNDYLTEQQYEAGIAAAKRSGDTGFVLSTLHGIFSDDPERRFYIGKPRVQVDGQEMAEYWWCEFPPHQDYWHTAVGAAWDTAVYATNAHWGIYTNRELWQVVGGNIDFISDIDRMYPAWRDAVISLLDEWDGEIARGTSIGDVLIYLLDCWTKWPADEWVETFRAALHSKLTGGL